MLHNRLTEAGEETASVVRRIVSQTRGERSDLIPILQEIQAEYRYLPEDALRCVADLLNVSLATVYGVATFYAQFSLEPKGKWIIRVCNGTACHVRGSQTILDGLRKRLDLLGKETTTSDRRFSIEVVSCLGACGLAPVVVVGDKVHGQITLDALDVILDHLIESEQATEKGERVSGEVRAQ